jgi:branched-chain amino acid transport system ATP-binding protein
MSAAESLARHITVAPPVALEAVKLSAGYGSIPVLREVGFTVSAGEMVALLGANGAGKTTLLRTIAGILKPSAGAVHLDGKRATRPLFHRSRAGLAYVPEERGVFRRLTTMENLRLGRGDPELALELMPELRPLVNRRAGLLSGGEQQMLSLARALASQPTVLLCDELSLGLAPIIVERLMEKLQSAARSGVAILLVEQQARTALSVADRAFILNRGSVVLRGKTSELLSRFDEIEQHYLSGIATNKGTQLPHRTQSAEYKKFPAS